MALCANSGPVRAGSRTDQAAQPEAAKASRPESGSSGLASSTPSSPLPLAQDPALQTLTEEERNTIEIVRRTKNSVVFITNIARVRSFFSYSTQEVPQGSGSGFVWDDKGHIVTNNHVVEGGARFVVSLPNQEEKEAKLVGTEPIKDIAVLKLEDNVAGLSPVPLGSSRDLLVGQKAIAIGNPFGFDHTVTTGIVSALGRNIPGDEGITIRDMIQTDASINPGNSGGPLLDSRGELIGMNTVIISPSGTSSGVGFAVPVDTIKKIVPQIIEFGKVIRPGIGIVPVPDSYVRRARVEIEGAVIGEVPENSQAYEKGLRGLARDQRGRLYIQDVIVAIDDTKIGSYDDLYNALDNYRIGDTVTLTVDRNGKTRKVALTLVRID
jgi:S1-C subfamily serine protease